MKNYQPEQSIPVNGPGGFISYIIIALLVVIILILLGIFFFAPETATRFGRSFSGSSVEQQGQNGGSGAGNQADSADQSIELSQTDLAGSGASREHTGAGGTGEGDLEGAESASGSVRLGNETSEELADNIDDFFATLDSRDYIKDFQLDAPSDVYFPKLIQNLTDNPPVVSGETDDLFTILQNTAHFFRIIGKKNILLLKGILDRERDTFEETLADFYRLTDDPESLKEHFNLTIGEDELYAYAGFFLNTMGGRLYLFRRDSMSRMVVSFYAIQIIDKANREGRNKYGIAIKDAIDNLIIEIESSRIKLKMRDYYLDQLYDLKVRYQ